MVAADADLVRWRLLGAVFWQVQPGYIVSGSMHCGTHGNLLLFWRSVDLLFESHGTRSCPHGSMDLLRAAPAQVAVTLAAVPAWRLVTHAPWLLLHPVRLLATALGLRSIGAALLLASLQDVAQWADCQVLRCGRHVTNES
jgi:hypothetical protein